MRVSEYANGAGMRMRSEHMMFMVDGLLNGTMLPNRILQTLQCPRRSFSPSPSPSHSNLLPRSSIQDLLHYSLNIHAFSSTRLCVSEWDYGEEHDEGASDSRAVGSMNGSTISDGGRA